MSKYFQAGGQTLWNPSNGVAELFVCMAEAVARVEGVPTGIGPMKADQHEIDLDRFGAFVDVLAGRYLASRHPILRSMVEGLLSTSLVLVERAGRSVPALHDPPEPSMSDMSVGSAGMGSAGDVGRLRELREAHARAMPR